MSQTGAEVVAEVIAELNSDGRVPPIPANPEDSLLLADGQIDSLDLIDLVLALEKKLAADGAGRVPLSTRGTLDPENHEFPTVSALTERVDAILASREQHA